MRSENAVNNNLSKELLTIPDLYFFGMVIFLHLINIASIRQYVYNILLYLLRRLLWIIYQ